MSNHNDATIERVAKAMWDAYPAVWADDMPDEWSEDEKDNRYMTEITWDEFVRHNLVLNREYDAYRADDYRRMARAAIAEMDDVTGESDVRDTGVMDDTGTPIYPCSKCEGSGRDDTGTCRHCDGRGY